LRQRLSLVFVAVDEMIPARGVGVAGFEGFAAALEHNGIPAIWVTRRTRLEIDAPRRKYGHNHPFIAEGGSGVYLPQGYFHLRPESGNSKTRPSRSLRLGRFICVPAAEPQPSAAEALESLAGELNVSVVALRELSPRELAQNTGLPPREAELARQRDFEELFFFAGASDEDVRRFEYEAKARKLQLRKQGLLWSLARGASVRECVATLVKLYERAQRRRTTAIAIGMHGQEESLFTTCDRSILLVDETGVEQPSDRERTARMERVSMHAPDVWQRVLERIDIGN
jgi:mannosyl-3-phosphoglycerate phosphatase